MVHPDLHQVSGCALCSLRQRRAFTTLLAGGGALLLAGGTRAQQPAAEGVQGDVGRTSRFARLVPAEQLDALYLCVQDTWAHALPKLREQWAVSSARTLATPSDSPCKQTKPPRTGSRQASCRPNLAGSMFSATGGSFARSGRRRTGP